MKTQDYYDLSDARSSIKPQLLKLSLYIRHWLIYSIQIWYRALKTSHCLWLKWISVNLSVKRPIRPQSLHCPFCTTTQAPKLLQLEFCPPEWSVSTTPHPPPPPTSQYSLLLHHDWIPAAWIHLTQVIKDFLTPLCTCKLLSPMRKARPPVCMT